MPTLRSLFYINYFSHLKPRKLVAIAVPISNRPDLTDDEKISLRHLLHFLGKYDKYIIAPKSLEVDFAGFGIKAFDDKYFGSAKAHSRLMLSPKLYESFREYNYLLVYHLDALVFSDELEQWCHRDFDYIGAPWISHPEAIYAGNPNYEGRVGNGGFSLRKIKSFLNVIYSPRVTVDPDTYWNRYYASEPAPIRFLNYPKKLLKGLGFRNSALWEMSGYQKNEDRFWSSRARHYYPGFNIAPQREALRFAFDCVPEYCFALNDYTLPFGCHAWARFGREFWEPYLLKNDISCLEGG